MASSRVLAVVGATATGKTALAIEIARRRDGEIINADSRQVYEGMDIGTAKPTPAERRAARHWLIDIAPPNEPITLAIWLEQAQRALEDIRSRGKLPVVVGGTGQYAWALLEGWRVPRVPPNRALRAQLEALAQREGHGAVASFLRAEDPASAEAIDPRNLRRMIRAIEVTRATGRPFSAWQQKRTPLFDAKIIGLRIDRKALYQRIDARVDGMIQSGLVDEVRRLNEEGYGCELPPMQSIGYREVCAHLAGELTLGEAAARIKTETHRLARMQSAWFREDDERIHWLDADSPGMVEEALAAIG